MNIFIFYVENKYIFIYGGAENE